jgi:hypothetical protein
MAKKERPVLFVYGLEDILAGNQSAPGRKLSIASRSPHGHEPEGKVESLVPRTEDLRFFNNKEISQDEFRDRYVKHVEASGVKLAPGKLVWNPYSFFRRGDEQLVESGDVLYCLCLYAQKGGLECHRLWAAKLLMNAGWDVILHGDASL